MARLFDTGMSGQAGEKGKERKEGKEGKRVHGRLLEHERTTGIELLCYCSFYPAASRSWGYTGVSTGKVGGDGIERNRKSKRQCRLHAVLYGY